MCAGLGCPYTTYYGDCSYSGKGCYVEEKEKAANFSAETRKVLNGYLKMLKTMKDDIYLCRVEEELSDTNGDKREKNELVRDAWVSIFDAAEALEKALA